MSNQIIESVSSQISKLVSSQITESVSSQISKSVSSQIIESVSSQIIESVSSQIIESVSSVTLGEGFSACRNSRNSSSGPGAATAWRQVLERNHSSRNKRNSSNEHLQ